ncbi:MAG: hypothetical protein HY562_00390 [Ignavibacteriales bacterium]|nr:hypothetical protein [Ignavibacteriales bacterium]
MVPKTALAVSDALYLKPLLDGFSAAASPFDLVVDIPAQNALKLAERRSNIKGAFVSPLDYARHGGDFRIVPGVAACSSQKTATLQLIVNSDVRNIGTLAVDVRVTSEIVLAKIILSEKYRNISMKQGSFQILPMLPDPDLMLQKADAALVVNFQPTVESGTKYTLDLVEEWNDLTGLPYVHGFWVARESDLTPFEVQQLVEAKHRGVGSVEEIAGNNALRTNARKETYQAYLSSFTYELGNAEEESLSEFFHYSYFYGAIGDIPDLNFFEQSPAIEDR